jgi:hypothetical protein
MAIAVERKFRDREAAAGILAGTDSRVTRIGSGFLRTVYEVADPRPSGPPGPSGPFGLSDTF